MQRPDEKLEAFHLWAQADDTPRGFPVLIVLTVAGALMVIAAVAMAAWL